jgi:hypothetical protein
MPSFHKANTSLGKFCASQCSNSTVLAKLCPHQNIPRETSKGNHWCANTASNKIQQQSFQDPVRTSMNGVAESDHKLVTQHRRIRFGQEGSENAVRLARELYVRLVRSTTLTPTRPALPTNVLQVNTGTEETSSFAPRSPPHAKIGHKRPYANQTSYVHQSGRLPDQGSVRIFNDSRDVVHVTQL